MNSISLSPSSIDTLPHNVLDTRVSNELRFKAPSTTSIGKSQNDKTKPKIQSPMSLTMKKTSATVDSDVLEGPSGVSKKLIVETPAQTDAEIDKTPTQPEPGTPKKSETEPPKLDPRASRGFSIKVSKELNGEALKSLVTEAQKPHKRNQKFGILGQLPSRRSARVLTAPSRYIDITPSTNFTPEAQKKGETTKESHISPTPITHSTSDKEHGTLTKGVRTEETADLFTSSRSPNKLRKRQRDEELVETEAPLQKTLRKKIKHNPKALRAMTPGVTVPRARGPITTKSTAQSPLIEAPILKATQKKFNFTKLNINTLRALINHAIHHYSRLPKNLTDPNSIGALYRTFFPTSTYQSHAEALELDVDDSDLRQMMRMVWKMTDDGEKDGMIIWENLDIAWTKGGGIRTVSDYNGSRFCSFA